jgi:hypothetical protein
MNLRERAVFQAAHDAWTATGRPVAADIVARTTGFDDATLQQILEALYNQGHLGDVLRGDNRIDSVAFRRRRAGPERR